MRSIACGLLDLLVLGAIAAVLFVALTGGGVLDVQGVRVSLTRTGNPVVLGAAALILRYLYLPDTPLLGTGPTLSGLDRLSERLRGLVSGGPPGMRGARAVLMGIVAASFLVRLVNAWAFPGFTTGDDVEIHEMTLGALLGRDWPVWELRSPLYPMTVVYPVQALVHAWFGADVPMLVVTGRMAVVVISTAAILLCYRIALALSGNVHVAVLAAGLLAVSRLHLWFGSTELPRPVASVLILAAFWMLVRPASPGRAAGAGLLLGIGGALRFGELVFLAPATVHLLLERRLRDLAVVLLAAGSAALACLAAADWLYWGTPLHSLVNIVDYTLVRGESSRGFEPVLYYFVRAADWTNVVVLLAGLHALTLPDKRAALWAWIPVALLSVLPHKEARYVVPALPFVCIAAALSLQHVAAMRPSKRVVTVGALALAAAVVFEASNWRARRSDDEVRLAQALRRVQPAGVAAEQLWRLGGRLYLDGIEGPLIEIGERVGLDDALRAGPGAVLLLAVPRDPRHATLTDHGYVISPELSTARYLTWLRDAR